VALNPRRGPDHRRQTAGHLRLDSGPCGHQHQRQARLGGGTACRRAFSGRVRAAFKQLSDHPHGPGHGPGSALRPVRPSPAPVAALPPEMAHRRSHLPHHGRRLRRAGAAHERRVHHGDEFGPAGRHARGVPAHGRGTDAVVLKRHSIPFSGHLPGFAPDRGPFHRVLPARVPGLQHGGAHFFLHHPGPGLRPRG